MTRILWVTTQKPDDQHGLVNFLFADVPLKKVVRWILHLQFEVRGHRSLSCIMTARRSSVPDKSWKLKSSTRDSPGGHICETREYKFVL